MDKKFEVEVNVFQNACFEVIGSDYDEALKRFKILGLEFYKKWLDEHWGEVVEYSVEEIDEGVA